jgi:hypothetical protein
VYDQYGLGMSGVTVTFTDTGAGFTTADRTTNSSGVAVQPITDTTNETDTVTANAGAGPLTDTVDLFFVEDAADGAFGPSAIQSIDTTHSKIVAGGYVYTYDAGDFFYVGATATPIADFVDELKSLTAPYPNLSGTYAAGSISTFNLP